MHRLMLSVAVLLWGAVHSLLASNFVKDAAARHGGKTTARVYRLAYNAFALISFLPILLLMHAIPDRVLYAARSPWLWILLGGQVLAAAGLLIGLLQTGALRFIGLGQMMGDIGPERLVTTGLYRFVRHPVYSLGLLVLWLSPLMTYNLLAVFAALTIYIIAGAFLEERRVAKDFGDIYADYAASTPMLFPDLRRRRRGGAPEIPSEQQ